MPPKIQYTKRFARDLKRAPDEIKTAFIDSLGLFVENPNDPTLRNHALLREYKRYRSINVTDDWRALFREFQKGTVISFDLIRTHNDLYKKKIN